MELELEHFFWAALAGVVAGVIWGLADAYAVRPLETKAGIAQAA